MKETEHVKFTEKELEDAPMMVGFNAATDFKHVLNFGFCGKLYVLYDQ